MKLFIRLLILIIKNQRKIMGQLEDLKVLASNLDAKLKALQESQDGLQATVDKKQQAIADAIAALKEQIANGIAPEALQPIIDSLNVTSSAATTVQTEIDATTVDVASTPTE